MAKANQDPANISIAKVVNFTTTDLTSSNQFTESHTVSGPNGSFTKPLNVVNIAGNKVMVPLTSTTSNGSYWLKLHLPQPGSSKFYVTFAVKNDSYADGYYDYQGGIPSEYRTALRAFILDGATTPSIQTTIYKSLVFSVYGMDTNQVSAAIQFNVVLSGLFGTPLTPPPKILGQI